MKRLLSLCAGIFTIAAIAPPTSADEGHQADPAPLVDRVVAAAGGKANLLTRFTIHEQLNVGSNPEKPGKARESVFDGRADWWFRSGQKDWKKKKNEPALELVWAWTLQALVHPKSKLDVLPEVRDNGRQLVGVRIKETIEPSMDVYFDKQSLRLARIDWRKDINRFSDWQERDGVKYPARCVGTRRSTGKVWFVSKITQLQRLDKLPSELSK